MSIKYKSKPKVFSIDIYMPATWRQRAPKKSPPRKNIPRNKPATQIPTTAITTTAATTPQTGQT
ncbi:hypothetical protein I7I50_10629 [Histoplasma capsulatum G186AR]|uniref:Uncharacterized protein n=1 Tax=Ajellomyces capsulatus TaxID=5037 RepID=A0A8H7Z412_AJECA|nr:hypothetical protein I7I52_01867 [Histoplasma capsulatum]QSS69357.1 hypothetical protein I7I50_10629 [Histoplasma capsulatum G186AR]